MPSKKLMQYRAAIDAIDVKLIGLLADRMRIVDDVIVEKRSTGTAAVLPDRVEQVVSRVKALAPQQGLPPSMVEKIWRLLISEVCAYEEERLKTKTTDP